jgi:hypothetical protein
VNERTDVTNPILAAVSQLDGALFRRQNTGTFRSMDGKRIIKASSVIGGGDIGGCYLGRAVEIETKTEIGKQSASQINFQKRWEQAGGIYILARSPQEAVQKLKDSVKCSISSQALRF